MAKDGRASKSKASSGQRKTLDAFLTPKKTSPEESAASLAVLNAKYARARPKRSASKKASQAFADMIDPSVVQVDDEDDDFDPAKEVEIEDDDMLEHQVTVEDSDIVEQDPNRKSSSPKKAKAVGKRGRKRKNATEYDEDAKSTFPTSKLDNKRRIIRGLKDLTSARDKIERIYGLNEEKLLGLAKVKESFEVGPFNFPLENIQTDSQYYVNFDPIFSKEDVSSALALNHSQYNVIQESEFNELFAKRPSELRIVISDFETHLHTDEKLEFPTLPCGKRTGLVYNTGALVTDMAWLNTMEGDDSYLAISMSQYLDDPINPHLQLFSKEEHISCITIFRFSPNTLSFEKYHTIVHNFGETWNLKWHEGYKTESDLGLLGAVCQDGSVKFFKVEKCHSYEIRMYENASITISIPQSLISCFDFCSPTSIVCGFKNGNVAEFELGSNIPSYYYKIHDSYIISVVTAYSNYEDPVINTVSVDGYISAFNQKDVRTTKCIVGRARGGNNIPVVYCPQVYSVAHSDGVNSVKAYPPRAIFASHQICQHENTVSSLAASRRHPFLLSGSADGTLIINNLARRFLTGIKNNTNVYKYLKLWKWDYSPTEDKYWLDPNYEVFNFSVNEVSKARIDPHGVNISCVKWNEKARTGKLYAFVNNAGLLVIEELGKSD